MWAESTLMCILNGKLKEKFQCCLFRGKLLFSDTPTEFDTLHQSRYTTQIAKYTQQLFF